LTIKGAKSFDDLKTVDGFLCETFKEACRKLNLLRDDNIWHDTILEAADYQMPKQLRQLFGYILIFGPVIDPLALWHAHEKILIEDFLHTFSRQIELCINLALFEIEAVLRTNGKRLQDFELPVLPNGFQPPVVEIIDHNIEIEQGNTMLAQLNVEQKLAFDSIVGAVQNVHCIQRLFYLDGPGGSGKTFTYETVYHYLTGLHFKVQCVASTGVAATLLPSGKTAHSVFGIPVRLSETSVSNITPSSPRGQKLKEIDIFIWDEVTMTHYSALDLADRLLREIMRDNRPFGGKVVVLGGDFRQCLPVVKRGDRVAVVKASIKSSTLWNNVNRLTLKTNMRVHNNTECDFREYLLSIGDATHPRMNDLKDNVVEIPKEIQHAGDYKSLLTEIYGERLLPEQSALISKSAILTSKNDNVHKLNNDVLNRLEGFERTYLSLDSIVDDSAQELERLTNLYPTEFLNSRNPSGIPLHNFKLKVGAIVMLLRNLNSEKGLCNGTRLCINTLGDHIVTATVLTGKAEGLLVLIPKISLQPSDIDLPFQMERRQFPLALSFAMTINKSQGQSLDKVGIYLPSPVFSHGQLYVALSRCRIKENIKVVVEHQEVQGRLLSDANRLFTTNCVFSEIFSL